MNRFLYCCVFLCISAISSLAYGQETGGYLGIPWNSSFPVIERHFPGVEFVEEDGFHVTLFSLAQPEKDVKRVEFKLFENKLISTIRYYEKPINELINEPYINKLVTNLGPVKEIRKSTSKTLAGVAQVEIHEYADILVLFRYYPPGQQEGFVAKENSIVIIYKPTFNKMVYYRKHSDGETEEVVDYDYIEY
jgi:hypothetical protein